MNKKSKILPTKKEQIESLIDLHNTKHELAQKYNIETWEELFTVTKSEILSYIKSNYSLRDLGMYDKKCYLNLKKEGEKYIIYTWDYEYEMRTGEVIGMREEYYDSEDEVYARYVRFITGSSGTGLTFEDREED